MPTGAINLGHAIKLAGASKRPGCKIVIEKKKFFLTIRLHLIIIIAKNCKEGNDWLAIKLQLVQVFPYLSLKT